MSSMLLASFPGASSITTGEPLVSGSCWRSKSAKNNYSRSYVTTFWNKTENFQKEYCVMMSSWHRLNHGYKVIKGGPTRQQCEKKYVVNATPRQSFENEPQPQDANSIWDSFKDGFDTFNRFTRPYSAVGAVFEATSMSLVAVEKLSDLSLVFFTGWLQAVVAAFLMNTFNCGLNQLCDVEIDKVNKPNLPVASGELSFRNGVVITASSLILGLWFAWIIGSWPMFWILFVNNAVLAAAYSVDLPLLRWKKSPVLTTTNFLINAAISRPLGYFLHMQTCVLKRSATFPRRLGFCAAIMSIFAIVIAFFKDIPDVEGDEKFGIRSLSIRLGPKRVFWICISLLTLAYGGTILVGATSPFLWSKIFMVLGHAILALVLWYRAKAVDLKSNTALQSFYMFIWKLLCAEYLLIPLFR